MDKEIGNMNTVVVDKQKLLDILKENRAKHNQIYESALDGYYNTISKELEEKVAQAKDYSTELNGKIITLKEKKEFSPKFEQWHNLFGFKAEAPENHEQDYIRAMKKVELNVYDKFELNSEEFESYVMNNWTWKNTFLLRNVNYITGCLGSGYAGNLSLSGACTTF